MSFNVDLSKFAKETDAKLEKIMKNTVLALFNEVIERTPVDTGRLRGNWDATINSPSNKSTNATDKAGTKSKAKVKHIANIYENGDTMYLTNNLNYAEGIEYGKSTVKAPEGMVRVSVARINSILEREAKK